MGLSGVNFAVAGTGGLCLVENGATGACAPLCPRSTWPSPASRVGVLSPTYRPLQRLTRSATGQAITTLFQRHQRPAPGGELDGPDEACLWCCSTTAAARLYRDEELRKTFSAIRCGACMNHRLVYTCIGGHAYGTIYPGPIGKIISPPAGAGKHERSGDRIEACAGPVASVPVRIPIPDMLQRACAGRPNGRARSRTAGGAGAARSRLETLAMQGFASPPLIRSLSRRDRWPVACGA